MGLPLAVVMARRLMRARFFHARLMARGKFQITADVGSDLSVSRLRRAWQGKA
jgi:hypothetical protein